ncbi:hypothetical protein Syun_013922 [Stephania yunnanensis]|uniref:Uncharacterized protein n=1 Tax=Stephania yunnanensis TaxID=152371 RepID=A0AAP0JII2_9MAGN
MIQLASVYKGEAELGRRLTMESVMDVLKSVRLCDAPDLYLKWFKFGCAAAVSDCLALLLTSSLQGADPDYIGPTVDDEAVYYKVAGECPKGHVYSLGSLRRKKRRYADHDASTSQVS